MKWNGVEDEQAAALVQTSRGVYPEGTAVLFGLLMGLRRLEIAAVDWTRFTPQLDWYEVYGKGNIVEEIPVHHIVREEIQGRQTAYRYLFPGNRTAHVNPATVALWVAQIGTAAGIPDLTPHKLRHTFISDVNDKSGDLRVAQELARHASPETTAGYTRVTRDRMILASQNLSYAQVWPAVNE
jgi:integrase